MRKNKIMRLFWFIFMFLLPCYLNAQIITTIAGNGVGPDGSPATSARVYDPSYLAFDKYGNLYFSENLGNIVRKVDTLGIITTVAGTGSAGYSGDGLLAINAKLNQPNGIAVDTIGNLYIADAQNNRIREVSITSGVISTIAGSSNTPAFSGDGGPASSAKLFNPACVCFDRQGNMYIGDGNRVRIVNTFGIINTIAGNGLTGNSGDGGPATAAKCYPFDMQADNSGNLYIAEYSGLLVRKVTTSGIITTVAGDTTSSIYNGDEIPATNASLVPAFIAFNQAGELLISDYNNNRIRIIDASGVIHTIVGTGISGNSGDFSLATAAEINFPSGLAFDKCDNLYFGQVNIPRIRKVTFNTPPCTYLKIGDISNENLKRVYPNPADDQLNIDNAKTPTTYRLLNIIGGTKQQGNLKEGDNSISIKSLPEGLYLLEIIDEQKNRSITKIIKQ